LRFAQEQAIGMGHDYLGAEHLVLGLMLETSGMGYLLMKKLGVTFEAARAEVAKLVHARE
jgi:ATP-dependent Clp protease ATP-binding subunit ClpC